MINILSRLLTDVFLRICQRSFKGAVTNSFCAGIIVTCAIINEIVCSDKKPLSCRLLPSDIQCVLCNITFSIPGNMMLIVRWG